MGEMEVQEELLNGQHLASSERVRISKMYEINKKKEELRATEQRLAKLRESKKASCLAPCLAWCQGDLEVDVARLVVDVARQAQEVDRCNQDLECLKLTPLEFCEEGP